MKNRTFYNPTGFTLAEIIVSLLLLSIVAIGSFKTLHYAQWSANSNLVEFQQLQLEQQRFTIDSLKLSYPNVSAASQFEQLSCLIQSGTECP